LKLLKWEASHGNEKVSNPWREAIEGADYAIATFHEMFPILGGRLLKEMETCLKKFQKSFQSLEGGY